MVPYRMKRRDKRKWKSNKVPTNIIEKQHNLDEVIATLMNSNVNIDSEAIMERTDFLKASKDGDVEKLELMLKQDIDVNQQDSEGYTALMLASKEGHIETIRLLLNKCTQTVKKGVSASSQQGHNIVNAEVNIQNNNGWTALMLASLNGHTEVAKLLLDHHAQVDLQSNEGLSALMLASHYGDTEVAKVLLDQHAQVDLQSNEGWSALMLASHHGDTEVAKVLLFQHAQVDLQTLQSNGG